MADLATEFDEAGRRGMTDDTQLLQDAAERAKAVLPEPIAWALKRYLEPGDHVPLGADDVARAVLALPAPAVDREGLLAALQTASDDWDAMQASVTRETWEGTRDEWIADALIDAGQVGGTDAQQRIDAALALLDPSEIHHIAGPLADRLRRVLTGQDGDTDG